LVADLTSALSKNAHCYDLREKFGKIKLFTTRPWAQFRIILR
jgi:hypothetical protein